MDPTEADLLKAIDRPYDSEADRVAAAKQAATGDKWSGYLPSDKASAINRDREAVYGDPSENYRIFGELISPILGVKVSPMQAAMVVLQLKVMREHCGGYLIDYNDNLEDICGFSNVLHKVKQRYGRRKKG